MTRQWAPGDVVSALLDGNEIVGLVRGGGQYVYYADSVTTDHVAMKHLRNIRPLVVIDPEDREQVEALARLIRHCHSPERCGQPGLCATKRLTDALREFADPKPTEPTDPRARVTDRRENVWRLLADGDWVCTSGPDIGEYLVWAKLAAERGPLEVEVTP